MVLLVTEEGVWGVCCLAHIVVDLFVSYFLGEICSWLLIILDIIVIIFLVNFLYQSLSDSVHSFRVRVIFTEQISNKLLNLLDLTLFTLLLIICRLQFDLSQS